MKFSSKLAFPKIILVIISTFLALITLEIAVRILNIAPEVALIQKGRFQISSNPKLGYEPVPHLNYQGEDLNFYDYRGKANSLGFRDYEHNISKKSGVLRVAILGDSIAAGWGVLDTEKILPKLLEKELNDQGINAEVMNFSVSGYNIQQEIEIFKEKGIIFKPDLVILAYNLTDNQKSDGGILDTLRSQEVQPKKFILSQNRLLQKSHLFRIISFSFLNKAKRELLDFSQDTVETSLKELSLLSTKHNSQILVIVFPRFNNLQNYPFSSEHLNIQNYTIADDFYYLDLLPFFQECSKREVVSIDIYHPSEQGHVCAAKATSNYIVSSVFQE